MNLFWRSKSSKDKKQPLIQTVNAVGRGGDNNILPADQLNHQDEAPPPQSGIRMNAGDSSLVGPSESLPTMDRDANIPIQRVTSGEINMIVPKALRTALDADGGEGAYEDMNNFEVKTQDGSADTTAVVSAISMSTIGASVEREVNAARNLKGLPPLEVKTTKHKQKVTKKVDETPLSCNDVGAAIKSMPSGFVGLLAAFGFAVEGLFSRKKKSVDEVPVTARRYRRNHPDLLLPGNVPKVGCMACLAGFPAWMKWMIVGAVAASALAAGAVTLRDTALGADFFDWQEEKFVDWTEEMSVAFVGNSYLYVNDIPRLLSKMSRGRITEDSVINPSASLGKLLRAGNGMYELWQTDAARTWKFNTEWTEEEDVEVYDWGSCTVFQLLEGYDNDITYKNWNGAYYYEEDANPCFEDENYLLFLSDRNLKTPEYFNYVVLNDQTKRMADPDSRLDTIEALKYAYAPMIADSRARPLIVDTHAYPINPGSDKTIYGDIPTFQAMIGYGVQDYVLALKYNLPSKLEPKIVPVGMAYLTIYEEDNDMWKTLFLNSTGVHASPRGSYLFGLVLYASMYGHLPRRPNTNDQIKNLFTSARYMPDLPDDDYMLSQIFPSVDESDFLRLVARRVTLQGHVPDCYKQAKMDIENDYRNFVDMDCECAMSWYTRSSKGSWYYGMDREEEESQDAEENDAQAAEDGGANYIQDDMYYLDDDQEVECACADEYYSRVQAASNWQGQQIQTDDAYAQADEAERRYTF